ncbi:MAG: hypothetical protein ABI837_18590, partial [Acidobacteriota bacterium]
MNRQRLTIVIAAIVVAIALAGAITFVLSGQRVRRHQVFRPKPISVAAPKKVRGIPPVEQWTAEFGRLAPADLDDLLGEIESR